MTTTITKIEALRKYINEPDENIEQSKHDESTFEACGCEYLVLTDEEADQKAKEYILDSVWAFNKSFLDSHSEAISELDEKSFRVIQEACEGANKAILCMIDDKDHFVSDAIMSDGRGHFMSSYDGEENEQDGFYIYRIN